MTGDRVAGHEAADRSDDAVLGDSRLSADQRYRMLCDNMPCVRVEKLLTQLSSNVSALRGILGWRGEISARLDAADRRVRRAVEALEGFSTAYMRLKSRAQHGEFMRELRKVRSILSHGDGDKDGQVALGTVYATIRDYISRIGDEQPVDPDSVEGIVRGVRNLAGIHQTLHAVLVAELPRVAEPAAAGTLLDNGRWASLMCAIKARSGTERMSLIARAMASLANDMDRTARQAVKLQARTTADGSTESEAATASRRACALKASLQVMRRRLVALSSSFYRHRERQLDEIREATKAVALAVRHESVDLQTAQEVASMRHRHPIQRASDDILGTDASLDTGRGYSPHGGYSMAALMRKFKDNYTERITSDGKAGNA